MDAHILAQELQMDPAELRRKNFIAKDKFPYQSALGAQMFDSRELRVHPTGKALARFGTKSQGQGHETTFVSIDDCGNLINPMVVQGQIHGGLTMGLAPALLEEISSDESGNIQGGSFMDYLLPTAMETPARETDHTVAPSPHHPLGAKGVGESATVGAPPAIVNAVVDALAHLGVRHIDIPITPEKVWRILKDKGVAE